MVKPTVDYAVYLVTDSTPAILGSRDLVQVVEAALQGGVTIVQYRDKDGEHADVVKTARALHAVTQRFGVPLLINDRVAVAVEVGCEGVHIGQTDMGEFLLERRLFTGPRVCVSHADCGSKSLQRPGSCWVRISSLASLPTTRRRLSGRVRLAPTISASEQSIQRRRK